MFTYAVNLASVHIDHVSAMEVLVIDNFSADSGFIDRLALAVSVYTYRISFHAVGPLRMLDGLGL